MSDNLSAEPDNLAWVTTLQGLEDARVHLGELIDQMDADKQICLVDFNVQLGHVYGHLNRVWNEKHLPSTKMNEGSNDEMSQFPDDIMIT